MVSCGHFHSTCINFHSLCALFKNFSTILNFSFCKFCLYHSVMVTTSTILNNRPINTLALAINFPFNLPCYPPFRADGAINAIQRQLQQKVSVPQPGLQRSTPRSFENKPLLSSSSYISSQPSHRGTVLNRMLFPFYLCEFSWHVAHHIRSNHWQIVKVSNRLQGKPFSTNCSPTCQDKICLVD